MIILKGFVQYLLTVLMLSLACYLMRLQVDVGQICGFTIFMWTIQEVLTDTIRNGIAGAVLKCVRASIEVIEKRLKDDENSD